jgi:5-methylcytosine-specific restriction protein A
VPSRFYDLRVWRKLRRLKLERDPLCEHCRPTGRLVAAAHVDHIRPISQGGEPLDLANLASLCASCHSRKTARDMGNSDKPLKGAGRDGLPIDPAHPWHRGRQ